MKYKISVEDEVETLADMLNINAYKRAIWDIKLSLKDIIENDDSLEDFVKYDLPNILEGLNLDTSIK